MPCLDHCGDSCYRMAWPELESLACHESVRTKTARFYDTRVTAIGVIHHELSHLLVAIFTGARIDGVKLYKIFQKQDDEVLGYVNYTPRGLYPFRCIQQTLIGIAPGILGMVQICTMSQLLLGFWSSLGNDCFKHPAIWILAIVMSQIAYHSCPSRYDIQGSWFCIGLVVLAFCLFRDNIFPTCSPCRSSSVWHSPLSLHPHP